MKTAVEAVQRLDTTASLRTAIKFAGRALALILVTFMAMAEPFLAAVLGALSFGCFFVAVLFGFILHAPFQHRWFILAASIAFALLYVLFRLIMLFLSKVSCGTSPSVSKAMNGRRT